MPSVALYYSLILIELFFAMGMFVYIGSLLYSGIMGSPYVPTKQKETEYILKNAHLKKGQYLLEVGCGDGRFLRTAARLYGVKGLGIDINPVIIWWARMKQKFQGIKGIDFTVQNLWRTDLSSADVMYLFLMPEIIKKLTPRLEKETKRGVVIISHGFEVHGLKKYLVKKLERRPFPTYFYKLR